MPPAPPSPHRPFPPAERGFALLLVMILLFILFVLVGELAFQSKLEYIAASNVSDLGKIEYAIDGQLEVALALLKYDKKQGEAVDSEFDGWNASDQRQRTEGDVTLSMRIFDEQGKFSLARCVTGTEPQQKKAMEILARILDLFREGSAGDVEKGGDLDLGTAEDLAEKIVKYLKREGAQGQVPKPKTVPANVPLLLDEIVFADAKVLPGLLVDVRSGDAVSPGLHRFLTVHGTGRINVNTAPLVVLKALFSVPSDRDLAQGIVDRRHSEADTTTTSGMSTGSGAVNTGATGGNPFTDANTQLIDGSIPGISAEVLTKNGINTAEDLDVKSDFYSIRVRGSTKQTQRDELYAVERVKTEGFRFLLHQERTDPLLETADDAPPTGQ